VIEIPFDIRMHFLSLGPRVALRSGRLSAFGLVSIDGQWSQFSDQEVIVRGEREVRRGWTSSGLGLGFGGGVDVALTRRIALRPTQVNYSLGASVRAPAATFDGRWAWWSG
jgi:hypothetical protein